ncbi:MAG: metallophosphoesterase [Bacillota bacterium]|nr:metallophosphoesterase [Bacillota bacterium]
MRIGILSDSHGDLSRAEQAVAQMGAVDLLVHAGDYYRDALHLGKLFGFEVRAVVGNCDRSAPGPAEEILEIQGHRIYLTHGHLYGVKHGLMRLYYRTCEIGAEMVIFGHTHVAQSEEIEGIYFLNPGSVAWPRIGGKSTYAVLEFRAPGYAVEIFELP